MNTKQIDNSYDQVKKTVYLQKTLSILCLILNLGFLRIKYNLFKHSKSFFKIHSLQKWDQISIMICISSFLEIKFRVRGI